jgi:hypothetical protein
MNNTFLSKVYMWLFVGLLVTFAVSYSVGSSYDLLVTIYSNSMQVIIYLLQIVIAIVLGLLINKLSPLVTKILYILYAGLTGLTFSCIFAIFDISSIAWIFLATSIVFLVFALIGRYTKVNLNKLGIYLFIALITIIILEIINMFILNSTLDLITCILGILVFIGYIAYDIKRIMVTEDIGVNNDNYAVYGALQLYLDFINIFIRLLELFGRDRD